MATEMIPAPEMSVAVQPLVDAAILEKVLGRGDLSELDSSQRVVYLGHVCRSLGLNPLTQPISITKLGDRTVLYARKDCAEQLRSLRRVSLSVVSREVIDDIMIITARATLPDGRNDEAIGAVSVAALRGESRANAIMKAETKAKRRVTLSICGLGIMDESEVDSVFEAAAKPLPHLPALWSDRREMLGMFADQKTRVGDEAFYLALGAESIESAKDLQDGPVARRIYGALQLVDSQKTGEVIDAAW